MSNTFATAEDPDRLLELQQEGEYEEAKRLILEELEEAELTDEYDIGYEKNRSKTGHYSGTHFRPGEVSPFYEGPQPELETSMDSIGSEVEEFYVNLTTRDFRIKTEHGDERRYKLVAGCEDVIALKTETGYGEEREVTDLIYWKTEDGENQLKAYREGEWRQFGHAERGEGNRVMRHVELMEEVYGQLERCKRDKLSDWDVVYTEQIEKDFSNYPEAQETFENKIEDLNLNLEIGKKPEDFLFNLNPPWDPLLGMWLGNQYFGTLLSTEMMKESRREALELPEKTVYALKIHPAAEARGKFHLEENGKVTPHSNHNRTNIGTGYIKDILG